MLLNECIRLRDPITYVRDKNLLGYNKMGQVGEVVNIVRTNFMGAWKLEKLLTMDEMMI